MKLKMHKTHKTQKTLKRLKKRTKCPACGCYELITTAADQICSKCDWNTFYEYVETGLMDNVPLALVQHFYDVDMFAKTETESHEIETATSTVTAIPTNEDLNLKDIA